MAKKKTGGAYAEAGVNIAAASEAVNLMKEHVKSTYNKHVLSEIGAFGGMIDASVIKSMRNPVLVQSTDGAGTKMIVAEMMDQWTIGQDIVNHCVNDILTLGAKPLTFLDYVGTATLNPKIMEKIVENMAIACKEVGIPLLSGEIAEMPGVYQEGRHDVVGCITGVVERCKIIYGKKIAEGDVLIGLSSSGLHTNGYSLPRKVFFERLELDANTHMPKLGCTIGEELLKVHKCYFGAVYPLLGISTIEIHGIAHITGGGLIDNISRLLPEGLSAEISYQWRIPTVFQIIQKEAGVSDEEMRQVFNLGIGMVLIAPFKHFATIRDALAEYGEPKCILLGEIKKTRSKKEKRVFFAY